MYFSSTVLPLVMNTPLRPYSTVLVHRLSVVVGKAVMSVVMPVVDVFVQSCYLALRYVTGAILFPFARAILNNDSLHHWYMRAATILPGEYRRMHVRWANAFNEPLDTIDISRRIQEEAVLWLSQMPLDPSEAKAVVSSLALISSSHPHRFPQPVIVFLNSTLESSFRDQVDEWQIDVAIDCVLMLGHIKFQSAVDRNSDRDLDVGGVPITGSVPWAAQQLTIIAFQEKLHTPRSEGIRIRLLTAAAWLSPADSTEDVRWVGGEDVKIQGRDQFIQELRVVLQRHIHGEKVLDNKALVHLIHGMHASIPRGDYGLASETISFPLALCEDYDSLWSEDETVVRALITYALDLLSPDQRRRALVEREIGFDELASELIDVLTINNPSPDVVAFGFWLIYRVPYAFKSRKAMLADIGHIWAAVVEQIQDDTLRQRLNFHTVDAFVAIAQRHVSSSGVLPKFTSQATLRLLNVTLESDYTRPMGTYATAMILSLGKSNQVAAVTNEIKVEQFIEMLFSTSDDLESGTMNEGVIDLHIYSTLILLKLRPTVELDVGKVRGLIERMERVIGDPSVRDSGVVRRSNADAGADLNRVRWKTIYLSGLLSSLVPDDTEREKHVEGLRGRVQALIRSGELLAMADYEHCLEPLIMHDLELRTPAAELQGQLSAAFETWINEFPLVPLAGSIALAKT